MPPRWKNQYQCSDCKVEYQEPERHCHGCHETFSDVGVREYHRSGGFCWSRTALEMDLEQNDHAVWMRLEDLR